MGSRQVPCEALIALIKSGPVSSSQWTESFDCGEPEGAVWAWANRDGLSRVEKRTSVAAQQPRLRSIRFITVASSLHESANGWHESFYGCAIFFAKTSSTPA